jgi:hypothetical protein
MTTVELKVNLPEDVLEYMQREAEQRNVSLNSIASEVLAEYYDEPDEEEILSGLKRSMEQVLAGDFRPAREVLDEIKREAVDDANEG